MEIDVPTDQPLEEDLAPIVDDTPPSEDRSRLDPAIANQLSLLTFTNAIAQQQLNSALARNQVAAAGTVLTLGVQTNAAAMLKMLTRSTPLEAAAVNNLLAAQQPAMFATLNAHTVTPRGT